MGLMVAMMQEGTPKPQYKDGRTPQYVWNFTDKVFHMIPVQGEHTHVFDEWGMKDHVVCRFCLIAKPRSEVPYFNKEKK